MADRTARQIALVFSGAVSLGSFEAGVAYELVKHIQENKEPVLEIDVIVGTSAGALTGALTALVLECGLDPKVLEEAWLSVRLEDLLRLNREDRSILSSSKVEDLIARYINQPAEVKADTIDSRGSINLDIVVTNLDGIKYAIQRAKSSEFAIESIGYEDYFRFTIDHKFADWNKLRTAVRASSAYPGAFEPKVITRRDDEFPGRLRTAFLGLNERPFHYSDGGIVNNQPLNRAIEAVSQITDRNPVGEQERIFLIVDPSPPNELEYRSAYGLFEVIAKAVWTIPRNQTLYRDILLMEKANRRIGWKSSFVSVVAEILATAEIPDESVQAMHKLCQEAALFKGRTILDMDPDEYLEREEQRIRQAYKSEISRVAQKDFFVKCCFMLEQVADLRNKKEISLEMITPRNAAKELAGVIFGSFGGFLDPEFMKHDFNVGRTYAKRWLTKGIQSQRIIAFREYELSQAAKRKVFQKIFDNTLPLLIEDIGPKLMAGIGRGPGKTGEMVVLLGMLTLSLIKYVFKKTVNGVKSGLFLDAPPKK